MSEAMNEDYEWLPQKNFIVSISDINAYSFAYSLPYSEISEIVENLYLTSIAGLTAENFRRYNFQVLVDVCEQAFYNPRNIEYRCFRIEDKKSTNLMLLMDIFADEIHANVSKGKKTLVHCFAGASRSGALIISYLMKYLRLTLQEAYKLIEKRRSVVRPNNGFFQQLIDYEFQLFGESTAKMITYSPSASNVKIEFPDFFLTQHKDLVDKEISIAVNNKFFY